MFISLSRVLGFLLSTAVVAHSADIIGFRETDIDQGGARPLHISIWYPTDDEGKTDVVGENRAFLGVEVIRGAKPASTGRPLVVLSHGYSGSWRNLSWLAVELVEQGYVVAAPDHPGTTTFNMDPAQAAELWERPHDLSRVIDLLEGDPGLAGKVDANRIAAIGHSLGGWTVTALAGAQFDTKQFEKDCQANTSPRACALKGELGLSRPEIEKDMRDPRVRAFVSLDLGLARGFTPESLAAMPIPSLVVAAGIDIGGLPSRLETGYLADHLPETSSTYVGIPDAMHFSFMGLCKPGAAALIEKEEPGNGVACILLLLVAECRGSSKCLAFELCPPKAGCVRSISKSRSMFKSECRKHPRLDLKVLKEVAGIFKTSLTATLIRMIHSDIYPASMMIRHGTGGRKWHRSAPKVPGWWFPREELDADSRTELGRGSWLLPAVYVACRFRRQRST